MSRGEIVRVRLTERQARVYEAEAERQGIAVSTYLRDRLEQEDRTLEELAEIRASIADMADMLAQERSQPEGIDSAPSGGLPAGNQLEMLLLLRSMAGPQTTNMISEEVKRRGLETLNIEEAGNAPRR